MTRNEYLEGVGPRLNDDEIDALIAIDTGYYHAPCGCHIKVITPLSEESDCFNIQIANPCERAKFYGKDECLMTRHLVSALVDLMA